MVTTKEKVQASLFIFMAMPLVGGGLDIYAPSLLDIRDYFATTENQIQFSVTVYLLGYSIGILIIG